MRGSAASWGNVRPRRFRKHGAFGGEYLSAVEATGDRASGKKQNRPRSARGYPHIVCRPTFPYSAAARPRSSRPPPRRRKSSVANRYRLTGVLHANKLIV